MLLEVELNSVQKRQKSQLWIAKWHKTTKELRVPGAMYSKSQY